MRQSSLLIAPKFDKATNISFDFYKSAKKKLKNKDIICLEEKDATRENFEKHIKNCDIIAFWDHGCDEYLVDQNKNHLVDFENVELLKDKEIWTVACLSGRELGLKAIDAGAKLWQGYDETISATDCPPFSDLFENSLNEGYLLRELYNSNFKECEIGQKEAFKKNIEICESMPNNSGLFFASLLIENLKHLVYLTDSKLNMYQRLIKFFKEMIYKW